MAGISFAGNQAFASALHDYGHWHAECGIHHTMADRVTEIRPEKHRIELEDGNSDTQEALVLVGSDLDVTGYESRAISYRFDSKTFARERTKGHRT